MPGLVGLHLWRPTIRVSAYPSSLSLGNWRRYSVCVKSGILFCAILSSSRLGRRGRPDKDLNSREKNSIGLPHCLRSPHSHILWECLSVYFLVSFPWAVFLSLAGCVRLASPSFAIPLPVALHEHQSVGKSQRLSVKGWLHSYLSPFLSITKQRSVSATP